jgi:hypothetical protein
MVNANTIGFTIIVSRRILHSPTTEGDVIGIRFDTRLELADIDAFEIVALRRIVSVPFTWTDSIL